MWEAGLVNMSSVRIAKSCFLRTALAQVKKSARKIGCTGHLLVVLAQAFDCLVHRGLFFHFPDEIVSKCVRKVANRKGSW